MAGWPLPCPTTFEVFGNLEGLSSRCAAPLWLICQFWQNWQVKLQPTVPSESTGCVGRKWKSGFFSMGSTCSAAASP